MIDEAVDPVPVPATAFPTTAPTTAPTTQATVKTAVGQSVTASQVNVSDAGTVEIHVNDASLVEVLRMLSLQSQKNIIASKDVHGTVTANLYDVTVREALDAILQANGYDYREKGNFIYVYTAKEIAGHGEGGPGEEDGSLPPVLHPRGQRGHRCSSRC